MDELRKLREEQRQKWAKQTQRKADLEKKKEEEAKRTAQEKAREEEVKLNEARRRKEENDMWRHERLHAEIASKADSIEEANLMLEGHKEDFDFPLMKFMDGSLDFYKSRRIQEKYGIVRKADEAKTESLLGPSYSFLPDPLPPPLPFVPPEHEDDPVLQMAIHASLENLN